jgi:hypothetical protein
MITTSDFIRLAFTPDLTEGGIAVATRSLTRNLDRSAGSLGMRLRRNVGGVAVELAFRRCLAEKGIPFEVKGALPFSEPDRYDVLLGGHRCTIHTFLINNRRQINAMRSNPGTMLSVPALITEEQFSTSSQTGKELLLFAFLFGLTANSDEDVHKALDSGQHIYLVHPFRDDWSNPPVRAPLGRLALKSECATPVNIEIGGQDADRNFMTETLALNSLERSFAVNDYYSLAYIHIENIPTARIGIHSAGRREVYLVNPHEWGNIWIYGLEIWLAGYITEGEFRRKASTSFAGSRVFQYSQTQIKSLSVPMSDLRSLEELFAQVKRWEAEK